MYDILLRKLKNDLSKLKINLSKLSKEQLKTLQFINHNDKAVSFQREDKIILLGRGSALKGFEHILLRHFCDECEGYLNARDILYIDKTILKGRELSSFELNDYDEHGVFGYERIGGDIRYRVIIAKDKKGDNWVVTYYTNREARNMEQVDLS